MTCYHTEGGNVDVSLSMRGEKCFVAEHDCIDHYYELNNH